MERWFCDEVLPLEASLTRYLRRNWRTAEQVMDIRQDIYEAALNGGRQDLPANTAGFVFTIARNILINRSKLERIVQFEQFADLESLDQGVDLSATDRHLDARDALRRAQDGIDRLPPRCREVVRLRKIEGLTAREAAARMGVGVDTIERQLVLGIRAMADTMLGGTGRIRRGADNRLGKARSR
ncbi:RNA polymerase sigma factor [Sphingomonas sp. Leaf21]|uniref:RNA polymerase sigma factor n=1 Tax=Sphingomonas sp. Leaf21 TaxID=2876550 RepID=UPI001E337230|nr:RNA polymerase sigma factor [Sphingomonas sp. Leaf21]